MKKALGYLRSAVSAGKLAAELVRAQDFCPGKFYTWVPTRWLVRSTYILGCALCRMGRWDDADQAFKECLAMDSGDKLGARHKQLIAVLERDGFTGGDELEWLLQAKFGEDEKKDKVYALFNYTRALQAFCIHGDCDKSQSLLEYAVKKNPHVPPVLLAWENTKRAAEIMMLGTDTEAADYCSDNARYWYETTGALDWLERVYCEVKAIEPITNSSEVRQLLVQASQLMMDASETLHSPARKRIKEQGMEKLDHIEKLISNDSRSSSQRLKLILHHRRGMFLVELADFANALAQFNSALCLCDPVSDKDTIKELFYNRADCKKQAGDLRGALDDYTFVYQRFGAFSTAIENIRQLEAQLGASSVLPPRQSFPDVDANGEAQTVNDAMAEVVNNMPKVDLISQHKSSERCSNCQRGGIKLAVCDGCKEIKFCSKQCQIASWKAFHKYVCVGSKSRIATGTKVTVKGLENATQHNGKQGVVTDYLPDRKRFVVEFVSEDGGENKTFKLSLRPQKLSQNVA